jgi:mRNA interferase MazF
LILKHSMKQSEIWWIDLDPTKGAEIQKKRPAIIVNDDRLGKLPLKIIVPITDWKDRYDIAPWMVKIEPNATNGLSKTSSADCFQIRSLSQERLIKKLGRIDNATLYEIKEAVRKVLDL